MGGCDGDYVGTMWIPPTRAQIIFNFLRWAMASPQYLPSTEEGTRHWMRAGAPGPFRSGPGLDHSWRASSRVRRGHLGLSPSDGSRQQRGAWQRLGCGGSWDLLRAAPASSGFSASFLPSLDLPPRLQQSSDTPFSL